MPCPSRLRGCHDGFCTISSGTLENVDTRDSLFPADVKYLTQVTNLCSREQLYVPYGRESGSQLSRVGAGTRAEQINKQLLYFDLNRINVFNYTNETFTAM